MTNWALISPGCSRCFLPAGPAFLWHEAADHADQRCIGGFLQQEALLQQALALRLPDRSEAPKWAGMYGSRAGPRSVSTRSGCPDNPRLIVEVGCQAVGVLWRARLLGVTWADRVDHIGVDDAPFRKFTFPWSSNRSEVKLLHCSPVAVIAGAVDTLVGDVMNGKQASRRASTGSFQCQIFR